MSKNDKRQRPKNIVQLTRALAKISAPKVDLWKFQSTLQAVFDPMVGTKQKKKEELKQKIEYAEAKKKKRNKFITYEDEIVTVEDNSVFGKIRLACTCTPEYRTPEMLILLDSVSVTSFFRSFHVTWRREFLRRIELVEIQKGFTLFEQGQKASCAYFLLSGRLSNEVLIANKATDILKENVESEGLFVRSSRMSRQEQEKKNAESNCGRERMSMESFMPGAEIDVDCLRPPRLGQAIKCYRNCTVKAMDNVYLFRLTKESYDEGCKEQDYNEDAEIWTFFRTKSAGGLGEKIFKNFTKLMQKEYTHMWHLRTYESGSILLKQGDRAKSCYVLAHGTLKVIRKTNDNKLLTVDQPRIGEFVVTGAADIIRNVQKLIPVYKTVAETSLIAQTATDIFQADASLFYNFCYKWKWFGAFLFEYFQVLGLNDVQAKTSMWENKQWRGAKKRIVQSNINQNLFRLNAPGMQSGTVAKEHPTHPTHLTRLKKLSKKSFPRKRAHRIKPLVKSDLKKTVVAAVIEDIMVIPKLKRKQKRKRKVKSKKISPSSSSSIQINSVMLQSSSEIYSLLNAKTKSTRKLLKRGSSRNNTSKSQPVLPKVKERLQKRYETSLRLHKKRYGSHRLIRGSDLRWFVHEA
jgi:CRP-like cAMP-binding protein